jgi:IS5 family transposase
MPTHSTLHGPNTSSAAPMPTDSVVLNPVRSRAAGRLEPCAGKLACTVLRGEHAGNGVFLPDGKARKPYEFGVKSAVVVSHKHGLMLGARTFPGNPYDGHILSAVLEQATNLLQDHAVKLKQIVVDLGFRGVDADNPDKEIIHRGRYKSLSPQQKGWLRRRQAVEPAIGHLKSGSPNGSVLAARRAGRCVAFDQLCGWLQPALAAACHRPSGPGARFFSPVAGGVVAGADRARVASGVWAHTSQRLNSIVINATSS